LRQAYDYWQDQPGNYGAKRDLLLGETKRLNQKEALVHTMCRSTRRC